MIYFKGSFLSVIITILISSIAFTQDRVSELEAEVDNLESIQSKLNDSLKTITTNIDSLKKVIAQIEYEAIQGNRRALKVGPNSSVYEGDHVTTEVVANLQEGDAVVITEIVGQNYIKVKFDGGEGYMLKSNFENTDFVQRLIDEKEAEKREQQEAEKRRIQNIILSVESDTVWVESTSANIRSSSTTNSDILDELSKGDEIYPQKSQGNWIQIKYLNSPSDRNNIETRNDIDDVYQTGWIHNSLVSNQHVEPLSYFEITMNEIQSRREDFVNNNPNIREKHRDQILNGVISIGMDKDMVRASWGEPTDINRTLTANSTREQWIYESSERKYVYFENGVLTTIQD